MAGIRSLIALAMAGCSGMTFLILACTLHHQNWWPAIIILFYLATPFPILISKQLSQDGALSHQINPPKEWAYFATTGIVISALALPIVMARYGTIFPSSAALSMVSSTLFFTTIIPFFALFKTDSNRAF